MANLSTLISMFGKCILKRFSKGGRRNKDAVTDVISFAFEDNAKLVYNDFRVLGDIYICIPRMIDQARDYGHSEKRELSFLTVHGLLHLLGYDHQTKGEEKEMFALQELILNGEDIKR